MHEAETPGLTSENVMLSSFLYIDANSAVRIPGSVAMTPQPQMKPNLIPKMQKGIRDASWGFKSIPSK